MLLAPVATALPDEPYDVSLRYSLTGGPTTVVAGAINAVGFVKGEVIAAELHDGSRFRNVPEVRVVEDRGLMTREEVYRNVHVDFHSGAAFVDREAGGRGQLSATSTYAIGLIPAMGPGNASHPFLVIASPEAVYTLLNGRAEARLVPLDAVVTIRDAVTGRAVPGWDKRVVNEDMSASGSGDPPPGAVALRLVGDHVADLRADVFAARLTRNGEPLEITVTTVPGDSRLFTDAADRLTRLQAVMGEATGAPPADVLARLEPLAPVLDSAVILVKPDAPAAGGTFTLGGREFDGSGLTLMRVQGASVTFTERDQVRVAGKAHLAIAGNAFVASDVASVAGIVPLLSLALWAVAIGLIVARVVRKPTAPEMKPGMWRVYSIALHVLAYGVAFYVWDQSFAHAFGTSIIHAVQSGAEPSALATVAGIEMLPFSLAAFFFALPVRLAAGVAFRYTGRGKAWNGLASALGLGVLALLGPRYVLFFLNGTLMRAAATALGG